MTELIETFVETTEKYRKLLLERGCVIVGYSGGADSSCLLRLMYDFCQKYSIRLIAAHVNHGIRGDEADADENFCRNVCDSLGVEFRSIKIDVPALAESEKIGLEDAARRVRYAFFDKISEEATGSAYNAIICTAHNADDNLETVIFNLLRGSGLHGLGGIDPLRDGRYFRPLLYVSGTDIRNWCNENGVEYRIDSTNSDTNYTRNHIRHNIVPELAKICDDPTASISRMTALVRTDDDYISNIAEQQIQSGDTSISLKKLNSLHTAISSRVLRKLYDNAKDSTATIEEKHIREILRLISENKVSAELSLPGKMRYKQDRYNAWFEFDEVRRGITKAEKIKSTKALFSYPLDGDFFHNDLYSIHFSHTKHNHHITNYNIDENIYKLSILTTLRFDKIKGVLRIRYKNNGDVCFYSGHTHKLKRMFSDKKLTEREKELYPILYDDDGVIWVPGYPPRDGMDFSENGNALYITFSTNESILK